MDFAEHLSLPRSDAVTDLDECPAVTERKRGRCVKVLSTLYVYLAAHSKQRKANGRTAILNPARVTIDELIASLMIVSVISYKHIVPRRSAGLERVVIIFLELAVVSVI